MVSKLSFFVLAVIVSTGFAANQCRIGTVVNGRANSQPYSFPTNWNESHSAPHLAADQSCSWVVTIPQGYYAKIIMSGRINDSVGHFQTVDTNGNVIMTQHENKEPYYFPSPKFTLIVSNQAPATFGFKIIWAPFPTTIAYDAGINIEPHLVNITKDIFAAEFSAPGISLMAFPADPKNHFAFRSVMIFQGKDYTGTYLTNLFQIYSKKQQWIAPNALIYIVNLEASNMLDTLLIQSSQYTADINPYEELVCEPATPTCSVTLHGGSGRSGAVYVGNQNQTLTSVTMDSSALLSVYYGCLEDNFCRTKEFSGSNIALHLPITFQGGWIVQYVVSSGKSTLNFEMPFNLS